MQNEQPRLNLKTHEFTTVQGRQELAKVHTFQKYCTYGKPDIFEQEHNGVLYYFYSTEQDPISDEDLKALGFDKKSRQYEPDPAILEAIEQGKQQAARQLGMTMAKHSVGVK
jgi:hypothetical protein